MRSSSETRSAGRGRRTPPRFAEQAGPALPPCKAIVGRLLSRRGFTLLELLVAVAITLLLAGLMLTVTTNVTALWRRQQAAATRAITARQVLDQVERDLQSAVHWRDGNRWLAVDLLDDAAALTNHGWLLGTGRAKPAAGGSLRPLPPADSRGVRRLDEARFGLSGAWLRLVTTNVEAGASLPTVIAWQLARRPVAGNPVEANPASVRYSLYRSAVAPDESLAAGFDVLASAYGSTSNNPSSATSTAYRQPRNVTNPSHANLIASNVVDFGCWLYVRNPGGDLVRIYPASEGDRSHHAIGQSTASDSRFPAVADILVRILSEEGAAQIEALEAGRLQRPAEFADDAAWWWGVVEAHSTVFTRRVEILGVAP